MCRRIFTVVLVAKVFQGMKKLMFIVHILLLCKLVFHSNCCNAIWRAPYLVGLSRYEYTWLVFFIFLGLNHDRPWFWIVFEIIITILDGTWSSCLEVTATLDLQNFGVAWKQSDGARVLLRAGKRECCMKGRQVIVGSGSKAHNLWMLNIILQFWWNNVSCVFSDTDLSAEMCWMSISYIWSCQLSSLVEVREIVVDWSWILCWFGLCNLASLTFW